MIRFRVFVVLAALLGAAPAAAQVASDYTGAQALGLALRRLGTTGRVLMIGAHPDDEDTQLLAALALREGADVAYLSLTRGEGGQNGIGPELGEALGLLRSEELLAARRLDGARQFFGRQYDFGFSKSAEETFRHWPREEVLRDAVWVIRTFRPDIVVPVFSGTPRDGHGHHQVSGMIAREAFHAAADSTRFPEQIEAGLRPHRAAKLYQALRTNAQGATTRIAAGDLDPLIGRSAFQQAAASRSRHRSQDMGRAEPAGPRWIYLRREFPEAAGEEASIWNDWQFFFGPGHGLGASGRTTYFPRIAEIQERFNPLHPERIVPELAGVLRQIPEPYGRLENVSEADVATLNARLAGERRDAQHALALAAGLVLDAVADDALLAPGQTFGMEVSLWNGGSHPVTIGALEPLLPEGWAVERVDSAAATTVEPGAMLVRRFRVRVPTSGATTEPYFLRTHRDGDLYRWQWRPGLAAEPFEVPPVRARARVTVAGAELPIETEATFRDVDPRQGELRRPIMVVPAVSVLSEPSTVVLPLGSGQPARFHVRMTAHRPGGIAGTLRVRAPQGWRVEPAEQPLRFAEAGEVREVAVVVHAPESAQPDDTDIAVEFVGEGGERISGGVEIVDYPHIRARPLPRDAAVRVRAFPLRVPEGLRVGYVEGAGEPGPGILEQIGVRPVSLAAEDLASGDFSRFDVIVVGSRAYEVRPDLRQHNDRLLEWVRGGGHMVVLYNKYELVNDSLTPYPFTMTRPIGRVTDEAADVRILEPGHRLFNTPNRIGPTDWEGWVQERGLYFAEAWDPAYTPLLEMADPGEAARRGSLLVARHGQGTWIYTGLAFFRQLPAGVPGAWRLFANLLAYPGAER